MNFEETIIAPASGNSSAAIALIRISGSQAIETTEALFKTRKKLSASASHTLHFGKIMDGDEIVDEVLVSLFKNPHSYTGEDVVEISCHGSVYIQQRIIDLFISEGLRMANPGEFTMRAFKNGKLDLAQAEAVGDLIASDSKASHKIAMNQMRGGISNDLQALRKELIHFAAMIELELDFSGEDVEFADRTGLMNLLSKLKQHIQPLIDSFAYGNAIKQGVPVAILGKPNAGKSSLLNALLKEDRAIVSDIAGTTRDTIEDVIILNGIKFRLIDTAGLRETTDTIEAMGVKRSIQNALKSKMLLFLYDRQDTTEEEIIEMLKPLFDKELDLFLIENKIDKHPHKEEFLSRDVIAMLKQHFEAVNEQAISAHQAESVHELAENLAAFVKSWHQDDQMVITQTRHLHALKSTLDSIHDIENAMEMNIPSDLVAQDIRLAIQHLGSITGEIDVDKDILETIFGSFCIGK